jgi:hypothetical protein
MTIPHPVPSGPIYPEDVFRDLCQAARVPFEQRNLLRKRLEWAAQDWSSEKKAPFHSMTPSEKSAFLTQLGSKASIFKEFLEGVPLAVWGIVEEASHQFGNQMSDSIIRPVSAPPWDEGATGFPTVTVLDVEDGRPTHVSMDIRNIVCALDVISGMAFAGEAALLKVHSGPQPDQLLRCWIKNMRHIWAIELGHKFTRTFTNDGKPLSQAACLCVFGYRHLSPETPPSLINSEMKKRIAEDRMSIDGKNCQRKSKHSS